MIVLLSTYILNEGDAIGNDLLGMASTLLDDGHTVRLFAEKARVEADVLPLEELSEQLRDPNAVLIHHHSLQCDLAVRAIEQFPSRCAVKYHNVTPMRYFVDVNADLVRLTELGEQQSRRLAKLGVPFWVDSDFNGRELSRDLPNFRYELLYPFHRTEALRRSNPDAENLSGLDDWTSTLLCVGRVAPNKNLELALETLAIIRERDANSRLVIAGEHLFPQYSEKLRQLAAELGVLDALFVTGRVANSQLKALYLCADVLLVTSHHEGFCVPLVEAMGLHVPIVAVPRTAVPDTGGDAAVYATDEAGLAHAARELIDNSPTRESAIARGRARYREQFSLEVIGKVFRSVFARDLGVDSTESEKK